MIYLLLSIASSSLIFIIFKLFEKYNINTLQAIVVNYIIACFSGLVSYSGTLALTETPKQDWFYGTLILGIIFISVFNLMAITTQKNGLSVAAVATKMSIAIPIIFGIFVYKESTEALKISGILIALLAVYLTSAKENTGQKLSSKNLIFPILVFVGSGIIDTSLKFLETNYVSDNEASIFSAAIFGFAAVIGIGIISYKLIQKSITISVKNIIAGVVLGIPNYFSIYFLIKALQYDKMDSSTTFTINNVAILLVSTIAGILFFKEKLALKNWIGIALAILSIIMVTLAIK